MFLENNLNERQLVIKQHLDHFNQIAIEYEARWGVGKLIEYAGNNFAEKWHKQKIKLLDAVQRQDMHLATELVQGCIRGLAMAEELAFKAGHKPKDPEYWEVRLDTGFVLRVTKNRYDAKAVYTDGVPVWSLEELARVIEKDHTLINKVKDTFDCEVKAVQVTPIDFDWSKGDDLPPEF